MNKSLRDQIVLANKYIRWAMRHDVWGTGYFGSTWPVQIEYTHEISVSPKENVVRVEYIDYSTSSTAGQTTVKTRYNVNDESDVGDLRYEIRNYIITAIRNGAKESGYAVPRFALRASTTTRPARRSPGSTSGS